MIKKLVSNKIFTGNENKRLLYFQANFLSNNIYI